jgi:putative metallohydrolase (TIGR04338 family)
MSPAAAGGRPPDPDHSSDPQRDALYAAEAAALPDGGRRFRRFTEVESFVLAAVEDPWWEQRFPGAPVQVDVLRRSRSATFSAAHVSPDGWDAVIWIRDGSWDAVTVVHELAHVAVRRRGSGPPPRRAAHGPDFVAALADLWRRHLGLHAYGALLGCLADHGVVIQRDRRPPDSGARA